MIDYVKGMVEDFPEEVKESVYPLNDNLLKVDENHQNYRKRNTKHFMHSWQKAYFSASTVDPIFNPQLHI
jgi:hypothetical protein